MGRTYSFEPFASQQPSQTYKGSGPRLGNEEHKIALTKEEEKAALPDSPTGYGQAHAETVKRYRARAEKKRTEPRAPVARAKKAAPQAKPARKATTQEATAKAPARQAREETKTKAPASKKLSATELVGSIGRKVVTRAAIAAKTTVARAVKTATARKSTKKR
ncbi:hypothetical protein CYFUS_005868 [Cystobacter fuscus]|uniref:Uncharacterized protein n=1 Tax=Cystobacter fuscus TaxID=43 RepID=A0A250J921_9BACT|nr:hypothetical protein [Cystobacter fuscus]ATB40419.1 hypothetical protein CYFUS_005868 [Cystobacter fuscus]